MELTIPREALHAVLKVAARMTPADRATIPILANVLLTTTIGKLTVSATNLDAGVMATADAAVAAPGTTTVPARMLAAIVGKLPDKAEVTLSQAGGGAAGRAALTVRAGRFRAELLTLPVEDFPPMLSAEDACAFTMPAADLRALLERTAFAMSSEATRFYLCGIYLHRSGDRLRATTTDGHRLACADVALPAGAETLPAAIVPRSVVGPIAALIADVDQVRVSVSGRHIAVEAGATTLTTKVIDGTFPDYERVIPRANSKMALLERAEIVAAVDRMRAVGSRNKVKFAFAGGQLSLSATSSDGDTGLEELEAEWSEAPLEIGFNGRLMAEILEHVDGGQVAIALDNAGAPGLLRAGAEDPTLFVLMPMLV